MRSGNATAPPAGAGGEASGMPSSPGPVRTGPWTVLRLIEWSGAYLEEKGVEGGRRDAEHLLAHALGVERLQLYLQYDRPLDAEELDAFRPLLRRRARREPLQYILGSAAFRELVLQVDTRALIPRPETEVLVEEVLAWSGSRAVPPVSALDVGTGSGAIALSLALEGPFRRVVATDASADALSLAETNARTLGLAESVVFRRGDLFEPLEADERFDVVVSNPPYVLEGEAPTLQPEVAEWEPAEALFGGPDGLDVIRRLVAEVAKYLTPGGLLALEVGLGQAGSVTALVEATGAFDEVRVRRDYTGRERMVLARRQET